MDATDPTRAEVLVVHENPLLGAGLSRCLTARLGVVVGWVCVRALSDLRELDAALRGCRVVVLESPDPTLNGSVRGHLGTVPVLDISASVRATLGSGDARSVERLAAEVGSMLAVAATSA